MYYSRCKCGACQSYGSDVRPDCNGCDKCQTTLATAPSLHRKVKPHNLEVRYDRLTGKQDFRECTICWRKFPLETPGEVRAAI